jgi:hypothetical protein
LPAILEAAERLESTRTLASTAFQRIEPRLGREAVVVDRSYQPELVVARFFAFRSVRTTQVFYFSQFAGASRAGIARPFGADLFFFSPWSHGPSSSGNLPR